MNDTKILEDLVEFINKKADEKGENKDLIDYGYLLALKDITEFLMEKIAVKIIEKK